MKYFVFASSLFLAACSSTPTTLITTKHIVVIPEEGMYTCQEINNFPNTKKLTDVQVARFIVKLYETSVQCRNSLVNVKKFLEESKKRVETDQTPK
jgi:hypothetical protein